MTADVVPLEAYRRFYAEEIEAIANIRNPAIVDALAAVPRERFLAPGPWVFRSEIDFGGPARQTTDADPRRVYHNVVIGIEPERQLFNGAPGVIAPCMDALECRAGLRVLHVGCGLGYYTAVLAQIVGARGRVVAIEVDARLVGRARDNLEPWSHVEVRHGDGTDLGGELFDAILVNAGTTHPHEAWLNAMAPGARMVVPLTATIPQMGPIGKGFFVLFSDVGKGVFSARVITMVAIYSAERVRDDMLNARLAKALMRGIFPKIKTLRRDPHEETTSCWLHGDAFCLSAD